MAEHKRIPLKLSGKTIYVEVSEGELERARPQTSSGNGFENTGAAEDVRDRIVDAGKGVVETIQALAETVQSGIAASAPQEWSLEFSLGIDAKSGVPFVAEGAVKGTLKVTAKWKNE